MSIMKIVREKHPYDKLTELLRREYKVNGENGVLSIDYIQVDKETLRELQVHSPCWIPTGENANEWFGYVSIVPVSSDMSKVRFMHFPVTCKVVD